MFSFVGRDDLVFESELPAHVVRERNRRRRLSLAGVACGVLVVALNVAYPTPAFAFDAKSCLQNGSEGDDDYGQIDAGEMSGSSLDLNDNGVMADMRIVNADNEHCQFISSIAVNSPSGVGGTFEWGYIIGWWGSSPCDGVDHNHYYESPTLFNVAVLDNGASSCQFFSGAHPTQQSYQSFWAADKNTNTYWNCAINENQKCGSVNMDFSSGYAVVNMEAGSAHDSEYSHFQTIQEYKQSNLWSLTDDMTEYATIGPDYHYHRISGHEGETIQ